MMDVAKAAAYIGADSEMVQWPDDDDGSAANEPVMSERDEVHSLVANWPPNAMAKRIVEEAARHIAQAEQIGALICERDQLRREVATIRALLSRMPDEDAQTNGVDPIQRSIDEVCNHILSDHTTDKQRGPLKRAIERAESGAVGSMPGKALRISSERTTQ